MLCIGGCNDKGGGSKGGGGHLETYSKHEVLTGYFGTNTENASST